MHLPKVAQPFRAVNGPHPQYWLGLSGRSVGINRKDPENALIAYPGIPLESAAGMPQSLQFKAYEASRASPEFSPPSTAGDTSLIISSSGEGLSEPVMELQAVLGVFLSLTHARKRERERRERERERERRAREGEGSRPGQREKKRRETCHGASRTCLRRSKPSCHASAKKEGTKTRAGPKSRKGEEEGGRGEKKNRTRNRTEENTGTKRRKNLTSREFFQTTSGANRQNVKQKHKQNSTNKHMTNTDTQKTKVRSRKFFKNSRPDIKRIFPNTFGSDPPKHKAKT